MLLFCFFFYFVSYSLFLIFTLCSFCVPMKHGFLNLLSRYKLLLLEHFLFHFNVFIFYTIINFDSHYHPYYYYYYYYYYHDCCYYFYFCHCNYYFFISNIFNFYLSSFYDSFLYLCVYRIVLSFKHMT